MAGRPQGPGSYVRHSRAFQAEWIPVGRPESAPAP